MARKKQELSRGTLARLEEEMRLYPKIPRLKAEALVTAELSREHDENWWIKGSRKKSEPPLDELMKKEGNKAYQYYDQLAKDIEITVSKLTPELGQVIHECLWGMNSYYDWHLNLLISFHLLLMRKSAAAHHAQSLGIVHCEMLIYTHGLSSYRDLLKSV